MCSRHAITHRLLLPLNKSFQCGGISSGSGLHRRIGVLVDPDSLAVWVCEDDKRRYPNSGVFLRAGHKRHEQGGARKITLSSHPSVRREFPLRAEFWFRKQESVHSLIIFLEEAGTGPMQLTGRPAGGLGVLGR